MATNMTVAHPLRSPSGHRQERRVVGNVTATTPGGTSAAARPTSTVMAPRRLRPLARLRRPTLMMDTTATITGTGVVPGATVSFGGTAATVSGELLHLDDGHLSETYLGAVGQRHRDDTRRHQCERGGRPLRYGAPTITTLNPNSQSNGNAGTTVTITGTGFVSGATVSFGGNAGTSVTVVVDVDHCQVAAKTGAAILSTSR